MEQIIQYIIENKVAILIAVESLIIAAAAIAKLTPTQKDDNFIEKVRKFLEKLGSLFLPDIKQK